MNADSATMTMAVTERLERDFRILDAAQARPAALESAKASRAGHFIIRRHNVGDNAASYWVIDRQTVLLLLGESTSKLVGDALRLFRRDACRAVAADTRLERAAATVVVLVDRTPVGFIAGNPVSRGGIDRGLVSRKGTTSASVSRGEVVSTPTGRRSLDDGSAAFSRKVSAAWPDSVEAGAPIALLVSLASLGSGAASSRRLQLHAGARIDIVVRPLEGVTLDGINTDALFVSDPQADEPLLFRLIAGPAGRGVVRLYAFCGGRSVASFELTTTIVPSGARLPPSKLASAGAGLPASPRTQPDLSLLVVESGNEIHYRLRAAKGDVGIQDYPPVSVPNGSRDFFAQFANGIDRLSVDSPTKRKLALETMSLWGVDLFQRLLPRGLKEVLWEQRKRVGTVQITSDEAWIPWEVCRLLGHDADGRNVEGEFFAEAFSVTRWLHGAAAPEHFRFGEWALVVPKDSRLPLAAAEEAYILGLQRPDRQVTQVLARFSDVTSAMESERYHAWHFCGHASAGTDHDGDKAAIELENGELITADLFAGRVENALRTSPFVFLNACQSAQGAPSLTGVGGWAHRFIRPSFDRYAAAAFIGSYWSVYDTAAHGFAKSLYAGLLSAGKPIGQAVREARRSIRNEEDPLTWLAYTVYADPLATAARSNHDPACPRSS